MPRAVLRDGVIYPLDPLPSDWTNGQEVEVVDARPVPVENLDSWFAELERLCADGDPEEDRRLQKALDEAQAQAKTIVKRQMGFE